MRQTMIQRAKFNKNTNNLMIGYLKKLPFDELIKGKNSYMMGKRDENSSVLDTFIHIALCECLLYQNISKKGVIADLDQELLDYQLPKDLVLPKTKESLEEAINLMSRCDEAMVKVFETVDFESYDVSDFTRTEVFRENTPATFIEQFFAHGLYHRGQISQTLSELGVGEDFSRFQRFGVFE